MSYSGRNSDDGLTYTHVTIAGRHTGRLTIANDRGDRFAIDPVSSGSSVWRVTDVADRRIRPSQRPVFHTGSRDECADFAIDRLIDLQACGQL
ncbi:hypothetical protein [Gordonia phage GTE5]|uniref:Uncharacterized protein n=1 Tax=Gordonia phage GTE5 TaxID=319522 RepID=G8EJT9_9CAUD|nr:hypothetical protein GoPhGTE5p72 [Gordonia phage GTE5]AET09821.1 hypothetical protein [Gordonia phage GTE5]